MMTEPNVIIQWLLDNKLAHTFFHKESQEQMIEITPYGIEVNTILEKLKTTSNESKETNQILENAKKENELIIGDAICTSCNGSIFESEFGFTQDEFNTKKEWLEKLQKSHDAMYHKDDLLTQTCECGTEVTNQNALEHHTTCSKSAYNVNKVMTPEQRCYKILQESKYVRVPDENPAEAIEIFIKTGDGCPWLYPSHKIEERQFETNIKNFFTQYESELIEFAKNTPATIDGQSPPFTDIHRHTMDDQGFEGQIMSDGTYLRIIEGELNYIFYQVSDAELESKWQALTNTIKTYLTQAYSDDTPEEKSNELLEKVKEIQGKQDTVQAEITRRAKL